MNNTELNISQEFKAIDDELDKVLFFVENNISSYKLSSKFIRQVQICIEEAFINVCHYAYSEPNNVILKLNKESEYFIFTFIDNGKEFNPLSKKDPDITLDYKERKIGGLGIYMIKTIMDEVSYKYENSQNVLIMKKKIIN